MEPELFSTTTALIFPFIPIGRFLSWAKCQTRLPTAHISPPPIPRQVFHFCVLLTLLKAARQKDLYRRKNTRNSSNAAIQRKVMFFTQRTAPLASPNSSIGIGNSAYLSVSL